MGDNWNISITMDEYGIAEALEGQKTVLFFLVMFNLILPSILIIIVDRSFKKRILLTEQIKKAEHEEFEEIPINPGKDEFGDLIRSFNLMTAKIRKLIEVVYKKDAERKNIHIARNRAELDAMKRQINPHFMYNTLESIRTHSLVKNEEETADLMGRFSILLRQVTRWTSEFVQL
ncbi:MAG: histidine kinase [Lachnoclostridium sp.]